MGTGSWLEMEVLSKISMNWVEILYVLLAIQIVLYFLYFSGNWFMIKLTLEFGQVCFRVLLCVIESSLKSVLPWCWPRKDLQKELILITGAASGIGRLIAVKLARKGEFS